jgi:hypothetical protein
MPGEGFSAEHFFAPVEFGFGGFFYVVTIHHVVLCGSVEHRWCKTNSDLAGFL